MLSPLGGGGGRGMDKDPAQIFSGMGLLHSVSVVFEKSIQGCSRLADLSKNSCAP